MPKRVITMSEMRSVLERVDLVGQAGNVIAVLEEDGRFGVRVGDALAAAVQGQADDILGLDPLAADGRSGSCSCATRRS